jgi:hypothetical protein
LPLYKIRLRLHDEIAALPISSVTTASF